MINGMGRGQNGPGGTGASVKRRGAYVPELRIAFDEHWNSTGPYEVTDAVKGAIDDFRTAYGAGVRTFAIHSHLADPREFAEQMCAVLDKPVNLVPLDTARGTCAVSGAGGEAGLAPETAQIVGRALERDEALIIEGSDDVLGAQLQSILSQSLNGRSPLPIEISGIGPVQPSSEALALAAFTPSPDDARLWAPTLVGGAAVGLDRQGSDRYFMDNVSEESFLEGLGEKLGLSADDAIDAPASAGTIEELRERLGMPDLLSDLAEPTYGDVIEELRERLGIFGGSPEITHGSLLIPVDEPAVANAAGEAKVAILARLDGHEALDAHEVDALRDALTQPRFVELLGIAAERLRLAAERPDSGIKVPALTPAYLGQAAALAGIHAHLGDVVAIEALLRACGLALQDGGEQGEGQRTLVRAIGEDVAWELHGLLRDIMRQGPAWSQEQARRGTPPSGG
jgi:hypothetical protein